MRSGRGETVGRGHRRVVHGGDGEAHDQRADAVPDRAEAAEIELADDLAHLQRQHGEQDGDDDRGGEQRRVVAHQGVELHRHHAGVVHGADACAHQRAADQQAAGGDDRPGDDVQGHARAQDGGHDGQRGDPGIVGDRDRQDVGQHADEVHRPDAAAHGDGADDQPAVAQAGIAQLGDAGGELQEGVAAEHRDQVRQQDETVVVGLRQRLRWINVQREVIRKSHQSQVAVDAISSRYAVYTLPRREIQRTPPKRSRRSWQLQME